jgi:uncharacterized alpha-E superfamily protein
MLRSLGALQAFRRSVAGPALGAAVVGFCLNTAAFPRSVRGSLDATATALVALPERAAPRNACAAALDAIPGDSDDALDPVALRKQMDGLQIAIATIHDEVTAQYFSVETTR